MPLDQVGTLALTARDVAAVQELYIQLLPGANEDFSEFMLCRTPARWIQQMTWLAFGTGSADATLAAYEQGYVLEHYNRLLPLAQRAYQDYFILRTPPEWVAEMLPKVDGGAVTTTWSAAVVAAGGTVSAAQTARVKALVASLTQAGIWAQLDRLWLFAAENTQQALRDIVAAAVATPVAAPVFTANQGYKGNGSTQYIDTGFNPTVAPSPKYLRDNASFGMWEHLRDATGGGYPMGYNGSRTNIVSGIPGIQYAANINSGVGDNIASTGLAGATGLTMAQRTGPTVSALWRNGAFVRSYTDASVALVTAQFRVLANGATPHGFSASRISAAFIGASLAGKERLLYQALATYMVS